MLVALAGILLGVGNSLKTSVPKAPLDYWVTTLAFSPDGKVLASNTYCYTIDRGDQCSQSELRHLQQYIDLIDLDGCEVQLLHNSGRPFLRDGMSLEVFHTQVPGNTIAFHPNGQSLAALTLDNKLGLWDASKRTRSLTLSLPYNGNSVAYPNDGSFLLLADYSATRFLNDANLQDLRRLGRNREMSPFGAAIAISSDSRQIVTCVYGDIKIWDAQGGLLGSLPPYYDGTVFEVPCMSLSSDDELLALSYYGKRLGVQRIGSAERIYCPLDPRQIRGLAFVPGTQTLAIADAKQGLILFDVESGDVREVGHEQTGELSTVTCGPGGRIIATGNAAGQIMLWDADSMTKIREFRVDFPRHPPYVLPWWSIALLLIPWSVIWFRLHRRKRMALRTR